MTDTAITLPFDIATVESAIGALGQVLPTLTTFFPQLKVVAPFIPVIEGLVSLAKDLEAAGHDPAAIVAALSAHFQTIASEVQAAIPQLHPQATAPTVG